MAWIFRPKKTRNGKTTVSDKWHVRFRDEHNKLRVKVGYADRRATEQLGARLERDVAKRKEGIYVASPDERSPTRLVPIYGLYLQSKGGTEKHINQTKNRIIRILKHTNDRVEAGSVAQALMEIRSVTKRSVGIGGSNSYLTAIKGFCWWLVDFRGWPNNPLRKLKPMRSEAGKRLRRALSREDFQKLIAVATASADIVYGLTGVERAMLYLLAAYTGLRAKELSLLSRSAITEQIVMASASHTKNKRNDILPLPPAMSDKFLAWVKTRPKKGPLWPGKWYRDQYDRGRTADMIRVDLTAAGIPHVTEMGHFDFHSLRVQYVTELARAGVPLVTAQKLARHSDPKLTANIYSKVDMEDLKTAVAKLPGVG